MMKLFVYILSIYILTLNAIPCVDSLNDDCMHKNEISHNTNNNHNQDIPVHCSPFCTCNCCASPIINQVSDIHFECLTPAKKHLSCYKPSLINDMYVTIWQPPKIS